MLNKGLDELKMKLRIYTTGKNNVPVVVKTSPVQCYNSQSQSNTPEYPNIVFICYVDIVVHYHSVAPLPIFGTATLLYLYYT